MLQQITLSTSAGIDRQTVKQVKEDYATWSEAMKRILFQKVTASVITLLRLPLKIMIIKHLEAIY
jgi:hypothetical protein